MQTFISLLEGTEARLNYVLPHFLRSSNQAAFNEAYYLFNMKDIDAQHTYVCGPPEPPYDSTVRTRFNDSGAGIYAWPSRGGVILLDGAEAIGFEFLVLDPLDPPLERHQDQVDEDAFCRRLLLLGAKWWDSEERYLHVSAILESGDLNAVQPGDDRSRRRSQPVPTMREKRWIKVGYPNTDGLWVAEYEPPDLDSELENEYPPRGMDLGRVNLATSTDERCKILRDKLGSKFYESVSEYNGYGFSNAWEWIVDGEVGWLLMPNETAKRWRHREKDEGGDGEMKAEDATTLARLEADEGELLTSSPTLSLARNTANCWIKRYLF